MAVSVYYMETKEKSRTEREGVRVLAGILSVLIFAIGLPVSVIVAVRNNPSVWGAAFASLYCGIGFFTVAFTGRWFCFKRTHDKKNS